jgi:tRNA A-37 threonylcarbamoyl transferase component Bud32
MTISELSQAAPALRSRPRPTRDERVALRATLEAFQHPVAALELVRPCLNDAWDPRVVSSIVKSAHPDRFVLRVRVASSTGEAMSLALKVYSDDFGATMWALAATIADHTPSGADGLCLPSHYLADRRALAFPWVEGPRLSDIVDDRKPDLLRRAARLAAGLHRLPAASLPALPPMTPEMLVADTLDRCGRMYYRWPSMAAALRPLLGLVRRAAGRLHAVSPGMIHGDLAAGQFLWTGERLVLLDMDAAALADPACDVGHFLGQLERRCTLDASLPPRSHTWLSCFRDAYRSAMPGISWRNVSFYQGLTLLRKMYTLCRRDEIAGPRLAVLLVERARAAFEAVMEEA